MIYLDNGATSFPKPRQVTDAVLEAMTQYCANPGRSSHFLAARTAQEIYKTRAALALLLGLDDPGRILFTKNCTEALNLALRGILRKGDHVVTSSMEHNAVLRPLKALEKEGVETTIVRCDPAGRLDPQKIRQAIRPETRMIVVTAAEREVTEKLQNGLREIEGVTLYGSPSCLEKTAVVSCNLEGRSCEEVALALNDRYGIAVRAGLHSSGMAHETMGTQDVGCVRMCPGFYTSEAEIRQALEAVKEIAASK